MSMIKSIFLAILATLLLTFLFGWFADQWFGLQVHLGEHVLTPLATLGIVSLVAVILVLVGLFIVLSIFGSIFFAILLAAACIFFVAIGIFWPILVLGLAIWWLTSEKRLQTD